MSIWQLDPIFNEKEQSYDTNKQSFNYGGG